MNPRLSPQEHAHIVYHYVTGYLSARGWKREEPGSGWWWHPNENNSETIKLGEALDVQLFTDGVDVRNGE